MTLLLALALAADPIPERPIAAPVKLFASQNGIYGLRVVPKEKVIGRADGTGGRRTVVGWAGEVTLFLLDRHGKEMPGWTAATTFPDRALVSDDGRFVVAVTTGGEVRVERTIYQRRPAVVIYGRGGKEVAALEPDDVLTKEDRAGQRAWTDGVEFRLDGTKGQLVVTTPTKREVRIDLATGRRPERR
jgi:hypothetical protein